MNWILLIFKKCSWNVSVYYLLRWTFIVRFHNIDNYNYQSYYKYHLHDDSHCSHFLYTYCTEFSFNIEILFFVVTTKKRELYIHGNINSNRDGLAIPYIIISSFDLQKL